MYSSSFIQMIRVAAIWFAVVTCALAAPPEEKAKPSAQDKSESAADKPKPKITIGKETTYITEPLRPDGYPDYVAALNQRASQGVTAENNAAVLLLKALGPGIVSEKSRKDTFRLLDIDDLPDDSQYIVGQKEAIKKWRAQQPDGAKLPSDEELEEQFDRAEQQPWSDDEFPAVDFWLSLNTAPLDVAIRGIGRPKYYYPYISGEENYPPAISILLPLVQESRQIAYLLSARAMHELKLGHIGAAWRDLMACHRLARHIAAGQCLVESLVGDAIDSIAIQGDIEVAHYGSLSASQAKRMQKELEHLPKLAPLVDKIDIGERCIYLDAVAHVARFGTFAKFQEFIGLIVALSGGKNEATKPDPTRLDFSFGKVDWDIPLTDGNAWYDRFAQCGRIDDPRARDKALKKLDNDIKARADEAKGSHSYTFMILWFAGLLPKESTGQFMAKVFSSLLLPATAAAFRAEDRLQMMSLMDQTAFALAAYRADRGNYPEKLDGLVPEYVSVVPDDTFVATPTPIRYRREGDAYLLWSVFNNGIDDDGRGQSDDPPGDDWVLRPLPVKSHKAK